MIANKLYNDMINNPNSAIVPGNNSSGTSTQGSSTKDFKSSAKKRKQQQECYYLASSNPRTNKNMYFQNDSNSEVVRNFKLSHQLNPEHLNPNIFLIVDDSKKSNVDVPNFNYQTYNSRPNQPHNYRFEKVDEKYDESGANSYEYKTQEPKQAKVLQTIESEDRNEIVHNKIELFDDSKVSSIQGELNATHSDKDLENILHMLDSS